MGCCRRSLFCGRWPAARGRIGRRHRAGRCTASGFSRRLRSAAVRFHGWRLGHSLFRRRLIRTSSGSVCAVPHLIEPSHRLLSHGRIRAWRARSGHVAIFTALGLGASPGSRSAWCGRLREAAFDRRGLVGSRFETWEPRWPPDPPFELRYPGARQRQCPRDGPPYPQRSERPADRGAPLKQLRLAGYLTRRSRRAKSRSVCGSA